MNKLSVKLARGEGGEAFYLSTESLSEPVSPYPKDSDEDKAWISGYMKEFNSHTDSLSDYD